MRDQIGKKENSECCNFISDTEHYFDFGISVFYLENRVN